MITSNDFSILITTRANDSRRLEMVIDRIRKFYPTIEIVIVYDQVDICINHSDSNIIQIKSDDRVYVSGGYNLALENSSKPLFIFWHDDTFMTEGFIEYLIPNITEKQFCNFTQIEPPVYHHSSVIGRPIYDCGRTSNLFNSDKLDRFYKNYIESLQQKTIASPYGGFFMSGYKESILSVDGFDTSFQPYFHEDADLMMRLMLSGYRFIQSLEACAYHMVSLTARANKNEEIMSHNITSQIFTKKWGITFDTFKHYTIDNGLSYKKILTKLIVDNKYHNIELYNVINNYFDYNENLPYSIIRLDMKNITKDDIIILTSIPYILNNSNNIYKTNNLYIDINPLSVTEYHKQ